MSIHTGGQKHALGLLLLNYNPTFSTIIMPSEVSADVFIVFLTFAYKSSSTSLRQTPESITAWILSLGPSDK